MVFRRSYLFIAVVMVVVLAMAACGNGGSEDSSAPVVTAGQPDAALVVATVTTGSENVPAPTVAGLAPTVPAPIEILPATEAPPVVELPEEPQVAKEVPAEKRAPVTVEVPAQATEPEKEVAVDVQSDPSPSLSNGGETDTAFAAGDTDLSTVEVVKILTPSIVQITTESVAVGAFSQPVPSGGVGTGVIIDTAGHILTNNHVVEGAQTITVSLYNGERHEASLVGRDPTTDTAVIIIDADGLQPAKLGVSADLEVGEDVIAIGHALGLRGGPTVSKGVVSALERSIPTDSQNTIVDLIQTDASINPGNSGGALANTRAEVVGINTAIIPGSQGIGFAINIDDVKTVTAQLIEKNGVERGFLGITPFNLTASVADQLSVPVEEGIVVVGIVQGSGADAAGLREEDVIVRLGDEPIVNTGELSKFLLAHPPGETVDLGYYRRGTLVTTEITLGTRPG